MNADQKIKLLHDICDRNPHMRIQNALWRVRKAEKAEELRRPVNKQRGVVAMIRKLVHREGA
jgi:hypothetical protein